MMNMPIFLAQAVTPTRPLTEIAELAGIGAGIFAVIDYVRKAAERFVSAQLAKRKGSDTNSPIAICRAVDLAPAFSEVHAVQQKTAENIAALTIAIEKSATASEIRDERAQGKLDRLLDAANR